MRGLAWLLPAVGLAAAAPRMPELPGPGAPAAPDPWGAAVDGAIGRAQERVRRGTDVFEDHSTWDDAWRVRTEHYEVRTTVGRAYGLELAQGLEVMLGHFRALLGGDGAPAEPFVVLVLPDLAAYNQYGTQFGADHQSWYGSFYADQDPERPVAVLYDPNATQVAMWATHGALHQFTERAFSRRPAEWVSEGLASYFTLFWDFDWGLAELDRIRNDASGPAGPGGRGANRAWVPLPDLLDADLPGYADRTHARFIQLGALFTYLLVHRAETRSTFEGETEVPGPFAEYLRALVRGRDAPGNPARELLRERRAELEEDFRTFEGWR